jgi:hypothetical protein
MLQPLNRVIRNLRLGMRCDIMPVVAIKLK